MVLLDTHALLWRLLEPDKLSPLALATIQDSNTLLLVSSASVWELSIKHALGKLGTASAVLNDFAVNLQRLTVTPLPITAEHALAVGALPLHHRDPFDRMLVAQAQLKGVPIVTSDAVFSQYAVAVLW